MLLRRDEVSDGGGTVPICDKANRRPDDVERRGQPEALAIVSDLLGLKHAA